jgi:7,8-dihydropterin-6-yl-methyl-4-(beta-D-ribofuranosyl)aminobenzene 5'-phosphate synthase
MSIKITTLSENTAGQPDVLAEWGLSVLVETDKGNVLLDAGNSLSVVNNIDCLDIDIAKIDKIVLSHGHFDHTGGLRDLLKKLKRELEIICHPDVWNAKYSRKENKPDRYIGIPYNLNELESLGARFILTTEPFRINEIITTTGEIPAVTDFESMDPSLFIKTDEGWKPDPVMDDLALVVETASGLLVILGCAHRGMINTLYHVKELKPDKKIYMVMGGCHLKDATDEVIWQSISSLNELGVKKLALSHCTGMHASMILAQTFGEDFIFNHTGNIINLPEV